MIVNFDYFNRAIDPKLYICNPNNHTLAPIPNYDNLDIKPTFNGLSTLSVNIYKYIKDKDTGIIDTTRVCDCYKYIETHRQIHVENLGYFIINDFEETNDNINPYIEVSANSCEIELNNAGLDISDGTYQFYNTTTPLNTILGKILALCPFWKIGSISSIVSARYRTFADLNQQIYSFMSSDMSNAFECVVDFDIENRIINVLDSSTEIPLTDILLTFDNVIKNVKVNKSSENIVTALQVSGSDGLEIRNANPLGTNVIYKFDYYKKTEWMAQSLIDAINTWEKKIVENTTNYNNLVLQIITAESEYSTLDGQLSDLNAALNALKQTESVSTTADYPTAHAAVVAKQTQVDSKKIEVNSKRTSITNLNTQLSTLQYSLSLISNFTQEQYNELTRYIYQDKYQDDNITITNAMTYPEKQSQIKLLYAKGQKILEERCQPTSTITFECENFLLIPEFAMFREQLELGRMIHVELECGNIVNMALLQYEMNYDDKSLKITVSNRLKLHSTYISLGDLQSQVSSSVNTITFGKDGWTYPMRSGILPELDAYSKSALNLNNNPIIAADGQRAVFDSTGYHGFRLNPTTGLYDPKQMQLTNNRLIFTTDNWNTIKGAFGEFKLANGTTVYGLNADTIVAGSIDAGTITVDNINATNIKTGNFNADLIKTGRIESENGDYSLDMETGEVIMKNGIFSGKIEWATGSIHGGTGAMAMQNTHTIFIDSSNGGISLNMDSHNGVETGGSLVVAQDLTVHGSINEAYGLSGNCGVTRSDGSKRILHFTNGILDSFG